MLKNQKLFTDTVADVKKMLKNGMPQKQIADELCPEVPAPIRRALVKRLAKEIDAC